MAKKIIVDPKIMLGKPVFEGTRIPVYLVLKLLAQGLETDQIIKDYYPALTKEDIKGALHYAERLVKGEDVVLVNK